MEKQIYSIKELQKILGIGRDSAYKLAKTDQFPTRKVGKKIIIPKRAFDTWLQNNGK